MIEVEKGNVKKNIGVGDLVEVKGLDWSNSVVGIVVETSYNNVNVIVFDYNGAHNEIDDDEVYLNESFTKEKTLEQLNEDENYRLLAKAKDYNIKITY